VEAFARVCELKVKNSKLVEAVLEAERQTAVTEKGVKDALEALREQSLELAEIKAERAAQEREEKEKEADTARLSRMYSQESQLRLASDNRCDELHQELKAAMSRPTGVGVSTRADRERIEELEKALSERNGQLRERDNGVRNMVKEWDEKAAIHGEQIAELQRVIEEQADEMREKKEKMRAIVQNLADEEERVAFRTPHEKQKVKAAGEHAKAMMDALDSKYDPSQKKDSKAEGQDENEAEVPEEGWKGVIQEEVTVLRREKEKMMREVLRNKTMMQGVMIARQQSEEKRVVAEDKCAELEVWRENLEREVNKLQKEVERLGGSSG